MNKTLKALQEVWDSAPQQTKDHEDYVFLISWDWKGAPSQFHKKAVIRDKRIPKQTIYYMPKQLDKIYFSNKMNH